MATRFLLIAVVACVAAVPATLPVAAESPSGCTDVPLLVNGRDVGVRVGIGLGAYNDFAFVPTFGPDGDAEYVTSGNTIRVLFHPTRRYRSSFGPAFDDKYWAYVGLLTPTVALTGSCNFKGALVHGPINTFRYKGELRILNALDAWWSARGISIATAFAFYGPRHTTEKVLVSNYTGYDTVPLSKARYLCDGSDWWHNLYSGGWWSDSTAAAAEWIPFDVDVKASVSKAMTMSRSTCGSSLPTAEASFWGAFLGPEYAVGTPSLVFEVRNLQLVID